MGRFQAHSGNNCQVLGIDLCTRWLLVQVRFLLALFLLTNKVKALHLATGTTHRLLELLAEASP
jgi:hypothetical protein